MSTAEQVRAIVLGAAGRSGERSPAETAIGLLVFAVLTALGAEVRIPIPGTPVPVTLQTLFVLLAGAVLGPAAGAGSQALYLGLRAAGVTGFAAPGGGLAAFAGPTAGYLFGFIGAAALTGCVAGRGPRRKLAWLLASMLAGTVLVYACGLAWLSAGMGLSLGHAFMQGVLPFVLADLVKAAAAAALAHAAQQDTVHVRIYP